MYWNIHFYWFSLHSTHSLSPQPCSNPYPQHVTHTQCSLAPRKMVHKWRGKRISSPEGEEKENSSSLERQLRQPILKVGKRQVGPRGMALGRLEPGLGAPSITRNPPAWEQQNDEGLVNDITDRTVMPRRFGGSSHITGKWGRKPSGSLWHWKQKRIPHSNPGEWELRIKVNSIHREMWHQL